MPPSITVKVIYQCKEVQLRAADWKRIYLLELTGGTEKKVNHNIALYMYNPTLHISLSITVKAPVSIIEPNLCPAYSNL